MTNDEVLKLIKGWQNKEPKATHLLTNYAYAKIKELSYKQIENLPEDANTAIISQSATDIAHDSILKLSNIDSTLPVETQREFYSYLNSVVRSTFIDSYRKQVKSMRRNPDNTRLSSPLAMQAEDNSLNELSSNNDLFTLLEKFEKEFPRQGEAIQLRYLAQRSNKEISRLLDVSLRTIENDIRFAKAWLKNKF